MDNNIMDPDAPATPCGLIAKSWFNDTFELYREDDEGTPIEIV